MDRDEVIAVGATTFEGRRTQQPVGRTEEGEGAAGLAHDAGEQVVVAFDVEVIDSGDGDGAYAGVQAQSVGHDRDLRGVEARGVSGVNAVRRGCEEQEAPVGRGVER